MDVTAKIRYLHMAPRKVRLVIGLIRGLSVEKARIQLRFLNKAAAEPILKLLNSAAANARNNHGMDESSLRVKSVVADGGPILYRYRPRAMGRSAPIRKRTSHVTIVLTGEAVATKKSAKKVTTKKPEAKKPTVKKAAEAKKA